MQYKFSEKSKKKLSTVDKKLADVSELALSYSTIDFGISEGIRSKQRQLELYNEGKSKTLKSKHIVGEAVDVFPFINGSVSWDLKHFYPIVQAYKQAANELNVSIVWGGCWKNLTDITDPELSVTEYTKQRKSQGKIPFIDAAHFELAK